MSTIHAGAIRSPIAGRTDKVPLSVGSNSFVIPADIVSALGEGNTEAGYRHLDSALHLSKPKRASGGKVGKGVDILAAGGEYVVSPEDCLRIGGGDVKKGHAILDKFVRSERAKLRKTLKKLPGPVKG